MDFVTKEKENSRKEKADSNILNADRLSSLITFASRKYRCALLTLLSTHNLDIKRKMHLMKVKYQWQKTKEGCGQTGVLKSTFSGMGVVENELDRQVLASNCWAFD